MRYANVSVIKLKAKSNKRKKTIFRSANKPRRMILQSSEKFASFS